MSGIWHSLVSVLLAALCDVLWERCKSKAHQSDHLGGLGTEG